jgi:hypothetical protein
MDDVGAQEGADFTRDRSEDLGLGRAVGDEPGHPPQRGLLGGHPRVRRRVVAPARDFSGDGL